MGMEIALIASVRLEDRVVYTVQGVAYPITTMYDRFGEETYDPAECVTFVIRTHRGYVDMVLGGKETYH